MRLPAVLASTMLLLLFVSVAIGSDFPGPEPFAICESDSLCRNLFQQEHGEMSKLRFYQRLSRLPFYVPETQLLGGENVSVPIGSLEQLLADRMALYNVIYSESRCPPNRFWSWNETISEGTCTCYLDTDCRVDVLSLCETQTHPILLASFVIVICFQFSLIVMQNFCPKRKQSSKKSRRV